MLKGASCVFAARIGIDLGAANVLAYVDQKGLVVQEPAVVAIDTRKDEVQALGHAALNMVGRTAEHIKIFQPLSEGTMTDHRILELLLRYLILRVCGRRCLFRPVTIISVPPKINSVERRAVLQAAYSAGAKEAHLVSETLLSGLGAGLDLNQARGHLVVNIGAGTTNVAVLSMDSEVISESIKVGGEDFTRAIMRYLKKHHNLVVGQLSAEQMKCAIGTVIPRDGQWEIRGQDYVSGLPEVRKVSATELQDVLLGCVEPIIATIVHVLEQTPPELARDIYSFGMVLTGGGALLHGMDQVLEEATGIQVKLPAEPLLSVIDGIKVLMNNKQYPLSPGVLNDYSAG